MQIGSRRSALPLKAFHPACRSKEFIPEITLCFCMCLSVCMGSPLPSTNPPSTSSLHGDLSSYPEILHKHQHFCEVFPDDHKSLCSAQRVSQRSAIFLFFLFIQYFFKTLTEKKKIRAISTDGKSILSESVSYQNTSCTSPDHLDLCLSFQHATVFL